MCLQICLITFGFNNICHRCISQPPQHSLATFQLVHLQYRPRLFQLFFSVFDVIRNLPKECHNYITMKINIKDLFSAISVCRYKFDSVHPLSTGVLQISGYQPTNTLQFYSHLQNVRGVRIAGYLDKYKTSNFKLI